MSRDKNSVSGRTHLALIDRTGDTAKVKIHVISGNTLGPLVLTYQTASKGAKRRARRKILELETK